MNVPVYNPIASCVIWVHHHSEMTWWTWEDFSILSFHSNACFQMLKRFAIIHLSHSSLSFRRHTNAPPIHWPSDAYYTQNQEALMKNTKLQSDYWPTMLLFTLDCWQMLAKSYQITSKKIFTFCLRLAVSKLSKVVIFKTFAFIVSQMRQKSNVVQCS